MSEGGGLELGTNLIKIKLYTKNKKSL